MSDTPTSPVPIREIAATLPRGAYAWKWTEGRFVVFGVSAEHELVGGPRILTRREDIPAAIDATLLEVLALPYVAEIAEGSTITLDIESIRGIIE